MEDPSRRPGTDDGAGPGVDLGPVTGAPRWVKVAAIIAAVVVVLLFVLPLVGGGGHGPGRHSGDAWSPASPARRS